MPNTLGLVLAIVGLASLFLAPTCSSGETTTSPTSVETSQSANFTAGNTAKPNNTKSIIDHQTRIPSLNNSTRSGSNIAIQQFVLSPPAPSATLSSSNKDNQVDHESPYYLRVLRTPPANIELPAGKSVRLRCEFEGSPVPIRMKWYRNEIPLDEFEEPHRVNVRRQQRKHQAATQLRMLRLSVHDTAFYRCEATTEYGTEQATTVLRVHPTDLIKPPKSSLRRGGQNNNDEDSAYGELTVPDFSQEPDFDVTGAEIININEPASGSAGGETNDDLQNIERLLDRSDGYGMCVQYTGRECLRELSSQYVFVQSARAMAQLEERVTAALALYSSGFAGADAASAADRCPLNTARRALCVHVFPPCKQTSSSNNNFNVDSPQPQTIIEMCRDDCDILQGDLCKREFQLASQHVVLSPLVPKCDLLDHTTKDNFVEPELKCVSLGLTPPLNNDKNRNAKPNNVAPTTGYVEQISDEKCYMGRGNSYRGTVAVTLNNEPCKQWDALLYRQYAGHNFCRNPDTQRFEQPWCISSVTNMPTICRLDKCFSDDKLQNIAAISNKKPELASTPPLTTVPTSKSLMFGLFALPRNLYVIGGLVVGVLVLFMAIVTTSIFCRRKQSGSAASPYGARASKRTPSTMEERKAAYWGGGPRSTTTNSMPPELNAFLSPASTSTTAPPSMAAVGAALATNKAHSVSSGSSYSHEVPLKCLRFLECLGTGRFGKVYLGEMVANAGGGPRAIMVKTLMSPDRLYLKDEFYRQVTQWNDLLHPNVVSIIGINVREEPNCAVFEHSRIGDLHEFITSPSAMATLNNTHLNTFHHHHNNEAFSSSSADSANSRTNLMRQQNMSSSACLDTNDKLRIAQQIADGLDYLHSRGYNHDDVACRSCIVFDKLIVKVADYGIGHELYPDDYYECDDGAQVPLRWMSPEAITYRAPPHQTSNVWSFGVLIWELFSSGKRPYAAMSNLEALEAIQTRQLLPCPSAATIAAVPAQVYALMIECWHSEPLKRPTFKQLATSRIRQCQQEVAHATPTVLDSACSSTKWQHAQAGGVRGNQAALRSQSQASHSNSSSNSGVDQQQQQLLVHSSGRFASQTATPAATRAAANFVDSNQIPISHISNNNNNAGHTNTPLLQQPHPMALRGGTTGARLGGVIQNRYAPATGTTTTTSSSFAAAVASPRMLPRGGGGGPQAHNNLDFHHPQHQQQTVMYNTLNRGGHARSSTNSAHYYQNHHQSFTAQQQQQIVAQDGGGTAMVSLVNHGGSSRSPAAYYSNCQYNGIVQMSADGSA